MKPLNVFISRKLDADSLFISHLVTQLEPQFKLNIVGQSGIKFEEIPFLFNNEFDACCFYSKRAVDFFLQYSPGKKELLNSKYIIAFGAATADRLKNFGVKVDLVGHGKAADLAKTILQKFKGDSILFPQATNSRHSLAPFLDQKYDCISLNIYSNEIKPLQSLIPFDYLVFTSPLNVDSFLVNNELKGKIIAIGETTAAYIQEKYTNRIWIANQSSELELAKTIVKVAMTKT